jgi:hypothetical protein
MKQLALTEAQHSVIAKLNSVLKEANDLNIGLVLDEADRTLTAFNSENVAEGYTGTCPEEGGEEMNWDVCEVLNDSNIDYFNSHYNNYHLNFK